MSAAESAVLDSNDLPTHKGFTGCSMDPALLFVLSSH